MKIAVTAEGATRDSPVDPRFGRARGFVAYDSDTEQITFHDNTQNLNAMQGAGIQASRTIVDLGTRVLITGHVGPKAFDTLQAGGIQVCTGATGTVRETLDRWKAGEYDVAARPNVEGHWG